MSQVASAAANSVSSTSFVDGRSRDSFVVASKLISCGFNPTSPFDSCTHKIVDT